MFTEATLQRFWSKVDRSGGLLACWEWQGAYNRPSETYRRKHRGGQSRRPVFKLTSTADGWGLTVYAHRLSLSIHDGVPLYERQGLEACHTCDNYRCCNPAHLYWGTPAANRADRYGRRSTHATATSDATPPSTT